MVLILSHSIRRREGEWLERVVVQAKVPREREMAEEVETIKIKFRRRKKRDGEQAGFL